MKILTIHIKNLASLDGETRIDFTAEPLCSAGIFAITGPTGAGKSTILDALCLALYAQTPRYNKSNDPTQVVQDVSGSQITQSDPRGILRDGMADGLAQVNFIGVDGQRYQATWSVKRARNKADGNLQPYSVLLKNISTNTDVQGTKTEILAAITRVVGLSFEQFTRAVLLAQGDFTAFLKAGSNEKADLLEKLTGTQIYSEISKRIFENHRQEKEELGVLIIQKQSVITLVEDQLDLLKTRREELINVQPEQQKNLDALLKELAWHEQSSILLHKLNQSNEDYKVALVTKGNAQSREIIVRQVEQIQPTRVWIEGLKRDRQLLSEKEDFFKKLVEEIVTFQEQKINLDKAVKTAQENLESKSKEWDNAQSSLNTAKQLDVQLTERITQLGIADSELKQATETLNDHKKQEEQQHKRAQILQGTIETSDAFVEKHKNRQLLADNYLLVLSKLAEAQKFLSVSQQANEILQTLNQSIKTKKEEKEKQEAAFNTIQNSVKSLEEIHRQNLQALEAIDIVMLKKNKTEVDAKVMGVVQAMADWQTLYEAMLVVEDSKTTLDKNNKELISQQSQYEKANKGLETVNIQKEAAYRSLEIAKLASAENVLTLRDQLSKSAPCPVCGSAEHPYAEHDPQLSHLLHKLEEDYKKQESNYNELLKQHARFQEKIVQLEKDSAMLSDELILKEREIIDYRQNWSQFHLHVEAENRPVNEVAEWLKQQRNAQLASQLALNNRYDAWQKQQKETEDQKRQYDQTVQQFHNADNGLKDIRRTLQSLQEQLEQAQRDQESNIKSLDETKSSIEEYFTNRNWFEQWKNDPSGFSQSISQFANEWKTNTENLKKAKNEHSVLEATIKGVEDQKQHLLASVGTKEKTLSELDKQRAELFSKRQVLFSGRAVALVEKDFKIAVETATQELEQQKSTIESLHTNLTRTTAQKDEIKKDLDRLAAQITDQDTKLTKWNTDYNIKNGSNLNLDDLEKLLTLTPDWIENERKVLLQISNSVLQTQTVLQENRIALEKHREQQWSDRNTETVSALLAEARESLQRSLKESTEINLQLKQDAENREKAGSLIKQIENKELIVENWAKLNHVIGSADGKKFRQVAQEYTLDVLLGYTNVQLQMLAARYVLERIPQSLALQVIDQDMGNEIRTVNSLSGGESFLVSLALALGLASLSSVRMQVESLFIDEGFGSLDPNTLNVAMDALERLHNQGRKVGVISHVQEMTERIPTQIRVSKQSGGRSLVEVVGI
jgi:DNA repair protein SbcC/Rad50